MVFLAFGLLSAPTARTSLAQSDAQIEQVEDSKTLSSSVRGRLQTRARLRGALAFDLPRPAVPKQLGTVAVRLSDARARPRWSLPRRVVPSSDDDDHGRV